MAYILLNDPLQNGLDMVASFSTLSKTVTPITLAQMYLVITSGGPTKQVTLLWMTIV